MKCFLDSGAHSLYERVMKSLHKGSKRKGDIDYSYVETKEFWKYVAGPVVGGVFCYAENPATYLNSTHLMVLDNMDASFAVQGFTERLFSIEAHEQGPEKYFLFNEQIDMVT